MTFANAVGRIDRFGLVLLLLSTLAACVGAQVKASGRRPDWVDGNSTAWPRGRYLTGVGRGEDPTSAEGRARGEIARVFSTQVTARTSSQSSETVTGRKGDQPQSSFSSTVASQVEEVSQRVLEGVEIVERWQDPAERTSYALAALERQKGAAAVLSRLAPFDAQLSQWNAELQSATTRLGRVKAGRRLLSLLDSRRALEADLRILEAPPSPPGVDEAKIRQQAAQALGELTCAISFSGPGAHEVETAVIKALAEVGIHAATGPISGPVDVAIEGKASVTPVESSDPRWKFVRSSVSLVGRDDAAGRVFVQFDLADKGSAADAETAQRRSLANLASQVAGRLSAGISSYFENQ